MGAWYRVIKTIKGHRYVYEQRTRREGRHVRTENRYVGPADGGASRTGATGNGDGLGKGRPGQKPSAVTTTPPSEGFPLPIDDVFEALTAPISDPGEWRQPWNEFRKGKSIVKRLQKIDALIARQGCERTTKPYGASYNSRTDKINLPPRRQFEDISGETAAHSYYSTLLHELAHWTGHESRLKRNMASGLYHTQAYALEELVAEATSIIIMQHLDCLPEDLSNHTDYFQYWFRHAGERKMALRYTRREAERAARYIISAEATTTKAPEHGIILS